MNLRLILLLFLCLGSAALAKPITQYPSSTKPQTGRETYLCLQSNAVKQCAPQLPGGFVNATAMKCDGVTDDTASFQAAIASSYGKTLVIPSGICNISSTIVITGTIHILGAGSAADSSHAPTTLEWTGSNSTIPMIDLQGVRESTFEEFLIESSNANPLDVGIRSQTITGRTATANIFRHIQMNGTGIGLHKGWQFIAGTGGNNNNDVNSFFDCKVSNYTKAAWSFEHTQSKGHNFYDCQFAGAGGQTLQYGVTTALGAGNAGGSFAWFGGGGYGNAEADFYLGSANDAILISGANIEFSGRLLETTNSGSNSWPVTIQGVRFASDGLNPDGQAIIYTARGPLVLIGNVIGADLGISLQINSENNASASGVAIGNTIYTTLANPFINGNWVSIANNLNSGPNTLYPNTMMGNQIVTVISSLPTCAAGNLGQQAVISNGVASPAFNGTVSTTGTSYDPVACSQVGASTYGWVYR